jgi:hypothetical protein
LDIASKTNAVFTFLFHTPGSARVSSLHFFMTSKISYIFGLVALCAFPITVLPLLYHYHCADSGLPSPFERYVIPLKGSIVPLLGIFWFCFTSVHSPAISVVILGSTLGDLLMISIDQRLVCLAGFPFAISHIAFVTYWWLDLKKVPITGYGLMVPGIAVFAFAIMPPIGHMTFTHAKFMLYGIWLQWAACTAIARGCAHNWAFLSDWCAAIGYFAFCSSDAILLGGELKRGDGPRTTEMYVVLTYVVAQVLLYISLVMDSRHRRSAVVSTRG